jgi:steroid 5-alpha reductase family enzyme
MLTLWLLQRRFGDAGIVDVGWTFGVGALALFFAVTAPGEPARRVLVAVLAGLWSLRLGLHILKGRLAAREEEGRYRELRRGWGPRAELYMLAFFQIQAILCLLFAVPMLVAAANPRPLDGWVAAALAVWLVAVVGESVADRQLARFRARPDSAGRTCREGLWRLSRHPNYFFEWLHWWCYPLLAVGAPHAWVTLLAPLLMLLLLLRVTGIPANEAQALRTRGDDYRDYQRTTSAFVPWFPRRTSP